VSIIKFPAPALVEQPKAWKFLEICVDPVPFPPRLLLLVGDLNNTCRIFNPGNGYQLVIAHPDYPTAQEWLMEDEYERVEGHLSAVDIVGS
jgi:hypothetical protein